MHKIAVYGSLRKGEYNYNRMNLFGKVEYIKTTTVAGYDMYSFGPYPGIIEGSGTIVVDILDVDDNVYEGIRIMELGAGYREKTVEIDGDTCVLYVFDFEINNYDSVPNGDWVKFNNSYVQYSGSN